MLRIIVVVKYFYSTMCNLPFRFFFDIRKNASKKHSRDFTDLHFSLRLLRIWSHWTYVLTGVYFWFRSSRAGKHIGNRAHFPVRHKTRGQHVPDVWGDVDYFQPELMTTFRSLKLNIFPAKVIEREGIKTSFFHAIISNIIITIFTRNYH